MCSKTKLGITEFRLQLAYSLKQLPEKPALPKKRIHTFLSRKRRKPCKGCGANFPGQHRYYLDCFNSAHK